MSDIRQAHEALVERVLDGQGVASRDQRRSAFHASDLAAPLGTLVDKVAKHASRVTDEDVATVRAAGFNEDELFELVVCAAIGQATRQYEAAMAALVTATAKG